MENILLGKKRKINYAILDENFPFEKQNNFLLVQNKIIPEKFGKEIKSYNNFLEEISKKIKINQYSLNKEEISQIILSDKKKENNIPNPNINDNIKLEANLKNNNNINQKDEIKINQNSNIINNTIINNTNLNLENNNNSLEQNINDINPPLINSKKKETEEEIYENPKIIFDINKIDHISIQENLKYFFLLFYSEKNETILTKHFLQEPIFFCKMENKENIDITIIYSSEDIRNYHKNYLLGKQICTVFLDENKTLKSSFELPKNLYNNTYLFIISESIEKLTEKDFDIKNIIYKPDFDKDNLIKPNNISKQYFYYVNIRNNLKENYYFILTDERIEIINQLQYKINICLNNKFNILCGPKGTGKTCLLIYLCVHTKENVLYLNYQSIYNKKIDFVQDNFKYEIRRLFRDEYDEKNIIIESINKKIDSLTLNFNILEFLYYLIEKIDEYFSKKELICQIILDQFPFDILNSEKELMKLKEMSEEKFLNVILMIVFSLNKDSQKFFIESLNKNNCSIYYIPKLIIKNNDILNIVNNEKDEEFKNFFLNELGGLPFYYYFCKMNGVNYQNSLENLIKEDIMKFYQNENISILIDLLGVVKKNFLFSPSILLDVLPKIPLKYIEIFKVELNSNEIKWEELQNENLIKYYFKTFDRISNKKIVNNFFLRSKKMEEIVYEDNNLSKDIDNNFTNFKNNIILVKDEIKDKTIILYKIEFILPFFEFIIIKIIYERLLKETKYLIKLLDNSSIGGLMELIIIYDIMSNKKIFDFEIDKTISIQSIVPNQFSIKYFSNRKLKEVKRDLKTIDYSKFYDYNKTVKQDLNNKITFIRQTQFSGSYYDCALLIPQKDISGHYSLIVFQINIRKKSEDYLSKEEQEIILYHVKMRLENEYNIIIDSAYFHYILEQNNGSVIDNNTTKLFPNQYHLYDVDQMKLIKKNNLMNKSSLITDIFRFHNEASLLKDYNKINDNCFNENVNLLFIINKNTYSLIDNDDILNIIKKNLKNLNESIKISKNQFYFIGFFTSKKLLSYLTFFSFAIFEKNIYFNGTWKNEEGMEITITKKTPKFQLYCSLYPLQEKNI